MNDNENQSARAVQECVTNLLELVDQTVRGELHEEVDVLSDEATKTALMMIAAIVLSDGKYETGEQAFLKILVDCESKADGEMGYLREYAERWKGASMQVPAFFKAAVRHDARLKTEIARAMLREIQLLGNNACITDGAFEAVEHDVVRNYLRFLEEYMLAWQNLPTELPKTSAEGWTSV